MNPLSFSSKAAAVLSAGFLLAAVSASASISRSTEKTFQVPADAHVSVTTFQGPITVTGSSDHRVRIVVKETITADSEKQADETLKKLDLDMTQNGGRITVTATYDRERSGFWSRLVNGFSDPVKLSFELQVPADAALDLNTSGGSIAVDGVDGGLIGKTSGGSVNLRDLTGKITVATSGGSIHLRGCRGQIQAKTSGGQIDASQITGQADLVTSGGSIRIDKADAAVAALTSGGSIDASFVAAPRGNVSLRTSGGSIRVTLPQDASFDLDAQASAGSVKTAFDLAGVTHSSRSRLFGKANGGGPRLYLRSSAGSINISTT